MWIETSSGGGAPTCSHLTVSIVKAQHMSPQAPGLQLVCIAASASKNAKQEGDANENQNEVSDHGAAGVPCERLMVIPSHNPCQHAGDAVSTQSRNVPKLCKVEMSPLEPASESAC